MQSFRDDPAIPMKPNLTKFNRTQCLIRPLIQVVKAPVSERNKVNSTRYAHSMVMKSVDISNKEPCAQVFRGHRSSKLTVVKVNIGLPATKEYKSLVTNKLTSFQGGTTKLPILHT